MDDKAIIVLNGLPLGVKVQGSFHAGRVCGTIGSIAAARDAGHMSAKAIANILHSITSADVPALSFAVCIYIHTDIHT